jgi:hypothetical protein
MPLAEDDPDAMRWAEAYLAARQEAAGAWRAGASSRWDQEGSNGLQALGRKRRRQLGSRPD